MPVKKVCNKCGACCKGEYGPLVFPSDVDSISSFLTIEREAFLNQYCVHFDVPNKRNVLIYSLRVHEGKCVFLNEMNLCQIYERRPYQCRNAPFDFLANYAFWSNMKCIEEKDFLDVDSSQQDREIFEELFTAGYNYK